MEFMGLVALLTKGTPILLLGLLITAVVNTLAIRSLSKSVNSLKSTKLWSETYESDQNTMRANLAAVSDRVTLLQNKVNGMG